MKKLKCVCRISSGFRILWVTWWLLIFSICIALPAKGTEGLALSDLSESQRSLPDALFSRTQQYPTKYKKIIIDTIPRTGSIVLYNVLRFLFEDEKYLGMNYLNFHMNTRLDAVILFGHRCSDLVQDNPKHIYISSIRDPEDLIFSFVRVNYSRDQSPRPLKEVIWSCGNCALANWEQLDLKKQRLNNFHFLSFREFNKDLNKLLDTIESIFEVNIDIRDRLLICSCFSKSAIQDYLIRRGLFSFSEVDDLTAFHGAHVDSLSISKQDEAIWRQEIRAYMLSNPVWEQLCKRYASFL